MKKRFLFLSILASFLFGAAFPADVAVGTMILPSTSGYAGSRIHVEINSSLIYAFGTVQNLGVDRNIAYWKSTDGGATWSTAVNLNTLSATASIRGIAVWYDRWTPSQNGTKIHFTYSRPTSSGNASSIRYNTLDIAADTIGTETTVTTVASNNQGGTLSITVSVSGNIYVGGYALDAGGINGFFRSVNGGAAWAGRDGDITCGADTCGIALVPSNGGSADQDDIFGCAVESNASNMECGFYDDSANAWALAVVGSNTTRVAKSISVSFDSEANIWISHAKTNAAGIEDISVYVCEVFCQATGSGIVTQTNLTTGSAFTGTSTAISLASYSTTDEFALVAVISGQTATSGVRWAKTTNFASSWSSLQRIDKSDLSTQKVIGRLSESLEQSTGRVAPIWTHSGVTTFLINEGQASLEVAETPELEGSSWGERFAETLRLTDTFGKSVLTGLGLLLILSLLVITGAPPLMFLMLGALGIVAFATIRFVSPEVILVGFLLAGFFTIVILLVNHGSGEKV